MQMTRRTFTGSAAAMTAMAGVTQIAGAQATPEATPVGSGMESRVASILENYGVPGAVIGISSPELPEPELIAIGIANLETGAPISTEMHFRIASVTKTYVATVVLQLVDEGLVLLDDTIATILPDLTIANADIVTVRNLLNMRSGLPQLQDSPELVSLTSDFTLPVTFEQYAEELIHLPAHAEPDTEFEYNNFNYDILGEITLTITGETWDANVSSRILEPIGLSSTLMTDTPDMPAPFANGYGYLDQEFPTESSPATPEATPVLDMATPTAGFTPVTEGGPYDLTAFNPTIAGAAGGLISTVGDQLVWAQALATGELLSPESYAAQTDVLPADPGGQVGYGLGLLSIGGLLGHNGAINGYQSAVVSAPELGINIVVLTNAHPTIGFGDVPFEIVATLLAG